MNKRTKYYLLFLLLLFIIYLYNNHNINEYYNDDNYIVEFDEKQQIGNKLSSYFYYLTIAYIKNKMCVISNINNEKNKLIKSIIPEKSIVTNDCPVYLKNNLQNIQKIWYVAFWEHKQYFRHIYPIIKKNVIIQKNIKYNKDCVIHFRCSDIPFNKHQQYHLLKFTWFLEALKLCLQKTTIHKISIMNCNSHFSNDTNNKCKEWCDLLGKYLKSKLDIDYEIICNNLEDDIMYMLNSKCLISMGSSLSFCLGILSDNIFVYPTNSTDDTPIKCDLNEIRNNSFCLQKDFIKHRDIDDYNNLNNDLLY